MVKAKEIEITIDEKGEVGILVKGIKGKKCINVSKFLESSIGDIIERKKMPDYYEGDVYQSSYSKKKF